ncbi:MAG: DUF5333 domain-containing protein [Pacificibacter sp.]|uniref:DUF5333 domain-containing protein n=1 Tax=Pacificibacter sp. TaxID=1917866 RepID=UPI0032194482
MYKFKSAVIAALVMNTVAATASAKSLRDEPTIDRPMLSVAMAIEISDKCPSISARTLKGLNYLWGLKSAAKRLGYSDAEIKSYVESDAEKARMRDLGEAYMRSKGLDPASVADLCTLGSNEIVANTLTGSFLRIRK